MTNKLRKEIDNPTQKQIKEFWKWCGVDDCHDWTDIGDTEYEYCKKCGCVLECAKLPCYPSIGLKNLYRYPVPKLQDEGITVELLAFEHKGFRCICQDIVHDNIVIACVRNDNPALAVFWAVWQVKEYRNGAR